MPSHDFLRFLLVGGALALCNLGLLWLLVDGLAWPLLWACAASFLALNLVGYVGNKVFTFRLEPRLRGGELLRYYAVMAANLAINLATMTWLTQVWGWHYLTASVLLTVVLAGFNFAGHRYFTFGAAARPAAAQAGRPLRLLQVSAFFPAHGGGIEAVAGQLARRAAGLGFDVYWMAGGGSDELPAASALPGVLVERAASFDPLERRFGLPAPLWSPPAIGALWRAVGRCDLVQVHDYLYMPSLLALLFARMRSRPTVLVQHIGQIPFDAALPRLVLATLNRSVGVLALRAAGQVVFISLPVQRYFERLLRFRRAPLLIPNGVDHVRYTPAAPRAPTPDARIGLLFVGRFVEKKGLTLLRECLDLPQAQWTFIGWGPQPPLPDQSAARAHVQVLDRLPAEQIVQHYQQADLLVLPSTGEGFPLVVQEALACGTPVLVSNEVCEAFPAVDPRCVFHVELRGMPPAQAAAALRARLLQLCADPAALAAARPLAQALAQQWSWDQSLNRYADVYRSLAGAGAARA